LLAAGGLAPATLSMACCILPFVFVILGVSGSWIAYLTALSPYQPLFLGLAAAFIATGLWTTYRPDACADDTCAAPARARRLVRVALWLAAAQVITAVGVNLLAPHFL
jgi:mercuric ion transport protein